MVMMMALALAPAGPGFAAEKCLTGARETTGAEVIDSRTVAADGKLFYLVGIETFGLLLPDPEGAKAAEVALQRRLQALVAGGAVQIRVVDDRPDRYGRLPALIGREGRALVQETSAREGLAIAFAGGKRVPCFDAILAAEDEARRTHRGYWAGLSLPWARPEALRPYVGRFAIFEGKVISVGNRRARTYLNFGGLWSEDVTVEIDAKHRDALGGEAALAGLAGRPVRIRGFVEERSGPVVVVTSPNQLEILAEAAANRGSMP
ncbi:MAG TPA: thermonuclease family protein [Propylenella sp.]|nr:thermonuclease family protein [Propylenella sp.]